MTIKTRVKSLRYDNSNEGEKCVEVDFDQYDSSLEAIVAEGTVKHDIDDKEVAHLVSLGQAALDAHLPKIVVKNLTRALEAARKAEKKKHEAELAAKAALQEKVAHDDAIRVANVQLVHAMASMREALMKREALDSEVREREGIKVQLNESLSKIDSEIAVAKVAKQSVDNQIDVAVKEQQKVHEMISHASRELAKITAEKKAAEDTATTLTEKITAMNARLGDLERLNEHNKQIVQEAEKQALEAKRKAEEDCAAAKAISKAAEAERMEAEKALADAQAKHAEARKAIQRAEQDIIKANAIQKSKGKSK